MSHPIADLLKRALLVGATEVRLVPGRRTIVVLAQGESEVKGDPQTPEKITGLLAPVLTPAARQHLATGFAEWDFELDGRGPVRACAEVKVGLVNGTAGSTRSSHHSARTTGSPSCQVMT